MKIESYNATSLKINISNDKYSIEMIMILINLRGSQ